MKRAVTKIIMVAIAVALFILATGCTLVSENHVFPKPEWYWSAEAKQQRFDRAWEKAQSQPFTNSVTK